MRLATIRTENGTTAARLDGDVLLPVAATDVGDLLAGESAEAGANIGDASVQEWTRILERAERARGLEEPVPVTAADFAPVIPQPGKVICVGLNYRAHILETGRERTWIEGLGECVNHCVAEKTG